MLGRSAARMPSWLCIPGLLLVSLLAVPPGQAHLYGKNDSVVSLADGAHNLMLNSSSAWFAQFFASWCGHCQHFKPTWLRLAKDVKDWKPAVYLGVIDCGDEKNLEVCRKFDVQGFPTMKFFHAQTKNSKAGIKVTARDVESLRKSIIDKLEAMKESPPPACPPLEPISTTEVEQFFENNDEAYLLLIFERPNMYMAREVALDMVQYDGVSVRRVLNTQEDLVTKYQVTSLPSGYLLSRNGSISRIQLAKESRAEYTKFLRSLPGVKKLNLNLIGWLGKEEKNLTMRPTDGSKVYMADLESSLHYSLRVEVARFSTFQGERLKSLSNYISVLTKYFPARPMLQNLLGNLNNKMSEQQENMTYGEFADVLNNKNQDKDAVLASNVNYAWCQGSQPEYRGFPCTVWTLFHLLTVRAFELKTSDSNPQEVLQAMKGYVRYFFGCRECAGHFAAMAVTIDSIRDHDESILWLWRSHNRVNKRLAEDAKEDPEFPKVQWPTTDLCPKCRRKFRNDITWDEVNVLRFFKQRFSEDNISHEYLEDEAELLKKHKEETSVDVVRKKRETQDVDKEDDATVSPAKAREEETDDSSPITNAKEIPRYRPSIIRLIANPASQVDQEEILDLDAYENRFYPGRTLQDSNSRHFKSALHPKTLLDPPDADFDEEAVRERLLKRGVDTKYIIGLVVEDGNINWKGRWMKMLEVGFSRLDISLCVILYFLTSMGLLAMYFYLNVRSRFVRQRSVWSHA
ncbi:sulfhydryl oxidase 1 [Hyperolius riggenbachi]|uniref:sulfhydryl oxidase 1 n=1 Tax=Hyperolius riggenbachi TaxID=752182 RepID=UPI0035A3047D